MHRSPCRVSLAAAAGMTGFGPKKALGSAASTGVPHASTAQARDPVPRPSARQRWLAPSALIEVGVASIFVNYRREDSAPYAGRLFDRLVKDFSGNRVFMDIDGIAPGEDFVDVIGAKLAGCDAVVALIGHSWSTCTDSTGRRRLDNRDDFVRRELAAALERRIRVIPVLVGGASMPAPENVPEELVALLRRNALEITDARFHFDADRLIEALKKALATATKERERLGQGRPRGAGATNASPGRPAMPESTAPPGVTSALPTPGGAGLGRRALMLGAAVVSVAALAGWAWLAREAATPAAHAGAAPRTILVMPPPPEPALPAHAAPAEPPIVTQVPLARAEPGKGPEAPAPPATPRVSVVPAHEQSSTGPKPQQVWNPVFERAPGEQQPEPAKAEPAKAKSPPPKSQKKVDSGPRWNPAFE
jgi:hypothetical protein